MLITVNVTFATGEAITDHPHSGDLTFLAMPQSGDHVATCFLNRVHVWEVSGIQHFPLLRGVDNAMKSDPTVHITCMLMHIHKF